MEDDSFHCENCYTKFEVVDGDDNGMRGRQEILKDLLQKMVVMSILFSRISSINQFSRIEVLV